MSENFTEPKSHKQPSHVAYTVTSGKDGQNHWTKVGAAWDVQDGLSVQLDAFPVDGRIALRSKESLEKLRNQRKQRAEHGPENGPRR